MVFWDKVLWKGESPISGKIKVTEGFGVRRLVVEGYTQSRNLAKSGKTGFYWDSFLENLPKINRKSKILILGLGGGTSAKLFLNKFGKVHIEGVEIDPVIINLGKKFFYLNDPNIRIHKSDAKEFIRKTKDKYKVICVDTFLGSKIPDFIENLGFFDILKGLLERDGVMIADKICNDEEEDKEFVNSISRVFKDIKVSRERGHSYQQNVIVYGSN